MTKLLDWRVLGGMAAAELAAILISFITGCFYTVLMVSSDVFASPKISTIDGWMGGFLFVGGTAAIVAGVVTIPSLLLIGLPLYVTSVQKRKDSLRIYALGGLVISFVYCLILIVSHVFNEFLIAKDFYFAVISIFIAGPVTTSAFWIIVRPDRLAY